MGPSNNDPENSMDELQGLGERLEECLDGIQSTGSFALFGKLQNPPNPGLYLVNGGPIGLPLSDHDAQVIIAASHAAPFGKGHETIVDTSVRKTWEISPGDFEIKNPAWPSFLRDIVKKVSAGLGVDPAGKGVSAELYKLLLYDEGAMFKPHQDSEKAPCMFGTLVIALPSKHEGGEVRVSHAGNTQVFETSKFSDFHSSYLAWFSDVTHEVRPVLSGRRLVLTYNLVHTTLGSQHLAANSNKHMAKLDSIFSWWDKQLLKDNSDVPDFQAYLLEHWYTDASLCNDDLKGHDQQVASHLREVCNNHGFLLFLANLETRITGGCGGDDGDWDEYGGYGGDSDDFHTITDICDENTTLQKVVELDGALFARNLYFEVENLLQKEDFRDEDPDEEEDYSGFTGNEGVSATHLYRRTVAIFIPKCNRMNFLFTVPDQPSREFEERVKIEIHRQRGIMLLNPDDHAAQDDLNQVIRLVIRKHKRKHGMSVIGRFSDDFIAHVITTCLDIDNKTLFLDSVDVCSDWAFSLASQLVGAALLRYDLESSLPKFALRISKFYQLSDRIGVIENLLVGLGGEAHKSSRSGAVYQKWLNEQIHEAITSPETAIRTAKDGAKLANIAKDLPSKEVFNTILPTVKRNVEYTVMALHFLTELLNVSAAGGIPENVANTVFHDVTSDLAPLFTLSSFAPHLPNLRDRYINYSRAFPQFSRTDPSPGSLVDAQRSLDIAILLCQCQSLGLRTELDLIVTNMTVEAETKGIEFFTGAYFPILKDLMTRVRTKNVSVRDSPLQRLFQLILSTYIKRYVQTEPKKPKECKQPVLSCPCSDCVAVNKFFAGSKEKVLKLAMNQKRRTHVEGVLDRINVPYTTEKGGSPYRLVITKTIAQYEAGRYEIDKQEWSQRVKTARTQISNLGTEALTDFLMEMHGPITSLAVANLDSAPSSLQVSMQQPSASTLVPHPDASNRMLPLITKRKVPQKAIVIKD